MLPISLLVLSLWLDNRLIQDLRLHRRLLMQQRLALPDQVVGLERRREGGMNGRMERQDKKKRQIERRLTRVCCDLDRDSRISSTMRSERNDAMLSFTSLDHRKRSEDGRRRKIKS